jgi:hypothetical protein
MLFMFFLNDHVSKILATHGKRDGTSWVQLKILLLNMYVYYQSNFLCFFPQSPHYIWVFQIWFTSQFPHIQFSMKNSSMSKSMICDQLSIHLWYYIYPSFFKFSFLISKKTYLSLNSHYNVLYMWTFQPRPPWSQNKQQCHLITWKSITIGKFKMLKS